MADLTDEKLMQFADRTLSAADEARVAGILAEDPSTEKRRAAFEETAPGSAVFEPLRVIANAAPPARLMNAIMQAPLAPSGAQVRRAERPMLQGMLDGLFSFGRPRWAPAFATLLLALGGVLGWILHSASGGGDLGMLAIEGGRVVAHGDLLRALETARSGELVKGTMHASALAINVRLTFKSRDESGYCRQYDVEAAPGATFAGVGCRAADGTWQIRSHVPTKVDRKVLDKPVLVDDDKAMIAELVGAVGTGDPLDPEQESSLLSRRWRP